MSQAELNAQAKALLAAAGYGPNRPLKLTLLHQHLRESPEDCHRSGVDVEEKPRRGGETAEPGVENLYRQP